MHQFALPLLQARQLVETLSILDVVGVEGAFVFQFVSQISPHSDNPKYDLDMVSMSLVKTLAGGRHEIVEAAKLKVAFFILALTRKGSG